jgi:hypothetical protein
MRGFLEKEPPRMPQETIIIVSLICFAFGAFAAALAFGEHATRDIRRD